MGRKLNYTETRENIHEILFSFFNREFECAKDNEFDFEYLESQTDEILRLIKNQGGDYAEERRPVMDDKQKLIDIMF